MEERYYATGRRKTAVARVWITQGTGQIKVNNRTVEEYSVNNNTYMVKITPTAGAPYYLVDEDGSGEMAWKRGAPDVENTVPQWTLLSW